MVSSAGPIWFLEADVIFATIFTIVAILITIIGFKAYRFFNEEKYKLHSLGFFFLSASYLLLTLTNLSILIELRDISFSLNNILEIAHIISIGSRMHTLFFLAGLTFLLILYLQVRERSVRLLLF